MIRETNGKEKRGIYELEVKVRSLSSPKTLELLKNTILGTPGKLRYRQKEILQRIKSHFNIEFIQIQKGSRLFGTAGIIKRIARVSNLEFPAMNVRYLSISKAFSKRRKTLPGKNFIRQPKKNSLKHRIADKIAHHFEQPFIEKNKHAFFYAYVEADNSNSYNLCTLMGFKPARIVETLLFSRFNPKQSKKVQAVMEEDQSVVKNYLEEFYRDYDLYFDDRIFTTGFYFVLKEQDEIIGGIRTNPVNWEIVENPGLEGWLMQSVLPFLPFTNRIFHPEEFNFLAFDYAWHLPGREQAIFELMSHCCSVFGIHTGIIWGDQQSSLIRNIKKSRQLGFLDSVRSTISAHLMIRPINGSEAILEKISNNLVFVSSLDIT